MQSLKFLIFSLVLACTVSWSQQAEDFDEDYNIFATCNSNCTLPECQCSGKRPPGGLDPKTIPQIVYLTFERAVTVQNYPLYQEIFSNRTNPNGAKISGTFFVSHEYSDYTLIHQLWRQGHEIGANSLSYKTESQYWKVLNETMWIEEVTYQKETLSYLALIPYDDIQGMRAPFLQLNGDDTYRAAYGAFRYESSRPTRSQAPDLFPYTADFDSIQDCQIPPCPNGSYPGFWVSPIVDLFGDNGMPCAQLNSCQPQPENQTSTYNLLMRNFLNHYNGQRAPFGVYTTAGFLNEGAPGVKEGYLEFLDAILAMGDVFVVSIGRGLDWAENPQTVGNIGNIDSWKPVSPPFDECDFPFTCTYSGSQLPEGFFGERRMSVCVQCPPRYPWVLNPLGTS